MLSSLFFRRPAHGGIHQDFLIFPSLERPILRSECGRNRSDLAGIGLGKHRTMYLLGELADFWVVFIRGHLGQVLGCHRLNSSVKSPNRGKSQDMVWRRTSL